LVRIRSVLGPAAEIGRGRSGADDGNDVVRVMVIEINGCRSAPLLYGGVELGGVVDIVCRFLWRGAEEIG